MENQYIVIEGNIGAGKTTLVEKSASLINAKTLFESFADNPFLPKFYENPKRNAFPLELFFMAERYQQLIDDFNAPDLFQQITIADYHFSKSLLFASITLSELELKLFKRLYEIIYSNLPKPDLVIYIHVPIERLKRQIALRGREYEQSISSEYLKKVEQAYFTFFRNLENCPVVVVHAGEEEFIENTQNFNAIQRIMNKKWESKMHEIWLNN
ncbi:MAG: deoxynucleoside kinase [Chitinophagaceae bacterium]|nr:MAG: deoxynucleoside kinase [Chitinophagaceae bacterium]